MSDAGPVLLGRNVLVLLREIHADLSTSEQRIAAFVLGDAARVTGMSLAVFAAESGVSQPTAIRFCRRLGCAGFPDFKIRLAQSLMVGQPYVHREIVGGDGLATIADKIFSSTVDALRLIRSELDMTAIEKAVDAIVGAPRIELFGCGLSSVAAMDANQKFMRLGVPTIHHLDGHMQRMSAATLKPGDVAISFAYTGRVRDVLMIARVVRQQGATLIAITRRDSHLARLANIAIGVDTLEDTFIYAPMTSRMAHLAVVDVLATAVALRSGPGAVLEIRKVKNALKDQWLLSDDMPEWMAIDDHSARQQEDDTQ